MMLLVKIYFPLAVAAERNMQNHEAEDHSGCLDSKKILSTIDAPPGVPGVSKITFIFLQMKLFPFCAKIAPKRHKLQKTSKLKKKCQKNTVFLHYFEYSSIWGQS